MIRQFKLSGFCFEIEYPDFISLPRNYDIFECWGEKAEYYYRIQVVSELKALPGDCLINRPGMMAVSDSGREARYIGIEGIPGFYGLYHEINETSAEISIPEEEVCNTDSNAFFTSLLALEKRMLACDALILHCAYIEVNGSAILFSAPSETGKSTQAGLWEKYRDALTINGDRALLVRDNTGWYAEGWPVCGTSGICRNKRLPIRAIVMLSQAKENRVEPVSGMKAFSQVYSQITINRWNSSAHEKAMGLIEKLISEVEVWHLGCTISEEAVNCLEKVLV